MDKIEALKAYQKLNNDFVQKYGGIDTQEQADEFAQMQENFFVELPSEIKKDPVFYMQMFELLKNIALKAYYENDSEFVDLIGVPMTYALENADKTIADNKPLMLEVVKSVPDMLEIASEQLKDDADVVMAAVEKDGFALRFASEGRRKDKGIVMSAIKSGADREVDSSPLKYAASSLKEEKQFVLGALKVNPQSYRYVSQKLIEQDKQVKEACDEAYEIAPFYGDFQGVSFGYALCEIEDADVKKAVNDAEIALIVATSKSAKNENVQAE